MFASFQELIFENIVLISRALRRQFIIPDFLGFTRYVDTFYEEAKRNTKGSVPDYIPQLAKQDPEVRLVWNDVHIRGGLSI